VIGIDSYQHPSFMPLGKAEDNARQVATVLASDPFNFEVEMVLGAAATRQAILAALFRLRRAEPDDRLLVYAACHGYTITDNFGHDTGYLAAADTIPDQDFSALALEDVTGLRRFSSAKHIAFIFDACFSGQALGLTRAPSAAADKFLLRRAYQVISAGAADQTVADFQSMTTLLVKALTDSMTTTGGLYTLSHLGLYLQQAVAAESKRTQIPQFGHLRGSQGGEFIFSMATGPRLPHDLELALLSSSGFIRWGAVGELVSVATGEDAVLSRVAHEWLERLAETDPDERVKHSARRFLDGGADAFNSGMFGPPALEDLRRSSAGAERDVTQHVTARISLSGIGTQPLGDLPVAFLYFTAGPLKGEYRAIGQGCTTLGRIAENTIQLNDTKVSRQHARIEIRKDCLWLTDMDSTNGTFVDDIRAEEPACLEDGTRVRMGNSAFIVYVADKINGGPAAGPGSRPDPNQTAALR
jgi:hypothetical protein